MRIKSLKVTVTLHNIRRGLILHRMSCPIALAVRRATHRTNVSVSGTTIYAGKSAFALPQKAINFIDDFDYGDHVTPFTFTARRIEFPWKL